MYSSFMNIWAKYEKTSLCLKYNNWNLVLTWLKQQMAPKDNTMALNWRWKKWCSNIMCFKYFHHTIYQQPSNNTIFIIPYILYTILLLLSVYYFFVHFLTKRWMTHSAACIPVNKKNQLKIGIILNRWKSCIW